MVCQRYIHREKDGIMIPFYMENKQDKSDYAKALAELKWLFEICPDLSQRLSKKDSDKCEYLLA